MDIEEIIRYYFNFFKVEFYSGIRFLNRERKGTRKFFTCILNESNIRGRHLLCKWVCWEAARCIGGGNRL